MLKTIVFCSFGFLIGCSNPRVAYKKPTKREIKKAMSYSTWEYSQPSIKTYKK
jgi:hypothetical protein